MPNKVNNFCITRSCPPNREGYINREGYTKTDTDYNDDPQYVYVPLLPPLLDIIKRYGNDSKSGHIFPYLNGVKSDDEIEIKKKESLKKYL